MHTKHDGETVMQKTTSNTCMHLRENWVGMGDERGRGNGERESEAARQPAHLMPRAFQALLFLLQPSLILAPALSHSCSGSLSLVSGSPGSLAPTRSSLEGARGGLGRRDFRRQFSFVFVKDLGSWIIESSWELRRVSLGVVRCSRGSPGWRDGHGTRAKSGHAP